MLQTHGDRRVDDWFWLRDRDDPAVLTHLRAENAYTESATARLADLRARLFEEIRSRIVETDLSVPVRKDAWWYYSRTVEGQDYPIHCRLPVHGPGRDPDVPPLPSAAQGPLSATPGELDGAPGVERRGSDTAPLQGEQDHTAPLQGEQDHTAPLQGEQDHTAPLQGEQDHTPVGTPTAAAPGGWPDEQVLLDENALAPEGGYLDVANLTVSPAGGCLAFAVDTTGDERFTLQFRRLDGGEDPPERIEGTSYSVAWADDEVVFYTRPDEANRPHQLWRHRLGTDPADDVLVHQEPDERFHLGVGRTKDGTYVALHLHSKVTSEIHVLRSDNPEGAFRVVLPRRQGVEYSLEHHSGMLLLVTNDAAENFRLLAVPADDPAQAAVELLAHRRDVRLEGVDVFARHLVAYERIRGEARIRVLPLGEAPRWDAPLGEGWVVPAPETPSTSWGGPNVEFESRLLRYEYSSLVTPRTVLDLDLDLASATVRKQQPVLGGYDPAAYRTERLWATAPDGTEVPLSVVCRRDTPLDGSAPCLLYGYGAYEHSIDPVFSSIRLSLLDRGFVFAIAHVRGGGELGRRWYEQGKLLAKPNTFHDFIACARALIDGGWTRPERLVARGGSAGGLLIGAVANMAPELFRAMVAEVPFVDCLTTILDETLPLTVIEWEEWGNPGADPEVYRVMKGYTPYDNVHPGRYPDLLVTAGLEDPRVGYWEPTKWVQRLRAADPANTVLLKVELQAGHAGPSGRYDAWRDEAFVLAFVLDVVGLADR